MILLLFSIVSFLCSCRILDIADFGAKHSDNSPKTAVLNAEAISNALQSAKAGDTIVISNKTYWSVGGIIASDVQNITFQIDGTLRALANKTAWPTDEKGEFFNFMVIEGGDRLTITSSGVGVINGEGKYWWDREVLNLLDGKTRPLLINIKDVSNLLVEKIHLINSPRFNLDIQNGTHVEVRYVEVLVERSLSRPYRGKNVVWEPTADTKLEDMILQPEDLNTDGFDLSGSDIYVHDCRIENDDDSIAIKPCHKGKCLKDCTQDILLERLTLIGFGASIGSIPPNQNVACVRNITFRNIDMPDTGKGIYIKSNPSCELNKTSIIEDILYEDVNISNARWWAIWIGPQQQHEPHSSLSGKCALDYPISKTCPTQGCVTFNNITLRNVKIKKPWLSPGVIKGNSTQPMTNVVFDNVVVEKGSFPLTELPWGNSYECEFADVKSIGGTNPKPKCL